METIVYLTYNDAPTGIYKSQVSDVCQFLNLHGKQIKLIALISVRGFFRNRVIIRKSYSDTIVIPMFPRPKNWALNIFTLRLLFTFINVKTIIARGPFAANMAIAIKKARQCRRVVFDARGAYVAEFSEYNVSNDPELINQIEQLESNALKESDAQLAVSHALVKYWSARFKFNSVQHVVIPCTLNSGFLNDLPSRQQRNIVRNNIGFSEEDILIVFSGSAAGWQSLELFDKILLPVFSLYSNVRLLMLTTSDIQSLQIVQQYPDRVKKIWLQHEEVFHVLASADYGWLVRESSVTNEVASPVKFAEYLASGLNVLISEGLGDYSDFVLEHHCGHVFKNGDNFHPNLCSDAERSRNRKIAESYFLKSAYLEQYLKLTV